MTNYEDIGLYDEFPRYVEDVKKNPRNYYFM